MRPPCCAILRVSTAIPPINSRGGCWGYPESHLLPRSIRIFDRHCSRRLAVIEVERSTEARVAIDCALICSHDRGPMDQSVFKTLVVAFSVIVINVFGDGAS